MIYNIYYLINGINKRTGSNISITIENVRRRNWKKNVFKNFSG